MNYSVKINGQKAEINQTKVSAYPLNRVWPGYQRSESQTEKAYFVNFDFNDYAEIEVETDEKIDKCEIRPTYLDINYRVDGNRISIKLDKKISFSVEINGIQNNLCFFVNSKKCEIDKDSDDVIYFGRGEHHPGIISPKSGQTVFIDDGAVVYGGIFIKEQKDVKIVGNGILDASFLKRGIEAKPGEKGSEAADAIRSMGLTQRDVEYSGAFVAYGCENLYIDGITILNSMFWTMILRNRCKNVTVNNVKIFGQWRYNSDGINICNSSDVKITNCFIRAFDDCVVVRGPFLDGEYGDMSNIEVKNCVLWCDWGINMEIFCADKETTISNINFVNNYVIHVSSTVMDIQTWFGSPNSVVKDVLYKNIMIDSNADILRPQFQDSDETEYVYDDKEYSPRLIVLQCGKIGRNLGNQQFEEAPDISVYHAKYENINYVNISAKEVYEMQIIRNRGILDIKNVKFDNCNIG